MTVVTPLDILKSLMSAMVASGGAFHLPTCILFVNDLTPDETTEIGDLTEATFGGYSAVAGLTWSGPFSPDGSIAELIGSTAYFAADGTGPSQIAYGYALTDSGKTTLKLAARFDVPKQFNTSSDALAVVARLQLGLQTA